MQFEASPSIVTPLSGRSDGPAEPDLWRALAQTDRVQDFARAWLTLFCRSAHGMRQALLLLGPPDQGPYDALARFPDGPVAGEDPLMTKCASVLHAAIERRRPAIESCEAATLIGYPLLFSGSLHGVALVEAKSEDAALARRMLRHLQWSSAGIEAFLGRDARRQGVDSADRAQFLIGAVDSLASQEKGVDAGRTLANCLARRLECDICAVGRYRRKSSRLEAVSQSAGIDRRNSLSRAIEAAQDEAIDQETVLIAPRDSATSFVAAAAHEKLSRSLDGAHVLTTPLFSRDQAVGAITLTRRDRRFTLAETNLTDALGAAAGPLLEEKWRVDRSLPALAYERGLGFLGRLFGPRHFALKSISIGLAAALAYLTFATDVYRVRARAQIQGETRRMASAPFDGFIHAQFARAGDVVRSNSVLAELEDNDLELERLRQIAHKRQYQLELDKALAKRDLAEINIARAQIEQTDAEIDLSDQMIARAKLRAPFDAVVVTGDLSQSVGKPVSRGDTLFELAPLDRYRMTAVAPESEIDFVKAGQHGELLLSALPGRTFPVEISLIASVAQAGEGVNGFEVIAPIAARDDSLRPGMEGVVKIEVGRRNVAWIWLHPLLDWLRIKIWSLVP